MYRNFSFARRLKLQQKSRWIAPATFEFFARTSIRSATADALGAFGDDLVRLLVKGSDLIVSKRVAVLKIEPKRGLSQALNNASAPRRLSQFFLRAAAETFRADGGAFDFF